MRPENKKMQEFLKSHNIKAVPKYLAKGSMRGCWRIWGKGQDWFNNQELIDNLIDLGFVDFDGQPLTKFSGNGGTFQIFPRHPELTKQFVL